MVLAGWPLARRKEDSVIVKIKRLTPTAKIPTRGSKEAAGLDLYADGETVVLYPGETKMIHTGIAMEIKPGVFGAIYPRSGLASKYGLRLANCVGVIDSDYRGEIGIPLRNDGGTIKGIKAGERVAQMIIEPYQEAELIEVDELGDTERGAGGFGSTGR